jgi:hypothetical protein
LKTWPVYILTKKGKAAKTIPARIRMYRFEIKYGINLDGPVKSQAASLG